MTGAALQALLLIGVSVAAFVFAGAAAVGLSKWAHRGNRR